MALKDYGYEDNRFENAVSENFHCSICLNVFKEPKMCRNNQHLFCSSCITRHLANSSRCPECNEELTVETLSQAPRVLLNYLSELKIKCDYFNRGCGEFVELGNLPFHVRNCGFAPVTCSNHGCGVEINKQDKIHHEKEICHFRKAESDDSREMRKEIEKLKVNQEELINNLTELKKEFDGYMVELKAGLKANAAELNADRKELKAMVAELRGKVTDFNANMVELKKNQSELKASMVELKEQLPSLKKDIVNDLRDIMRDVSTGVNTVQTIQPALHVPSATKRDVIVAGGCSSSGHSSVETYSWANETWTRLPPMKKACSSASSFVYENSVVVAGGDTGITCTDEMEAINIDPKPLQWMLLPAELPVPTYSHKTVPLENSGNRLIVVGGYNGGKCQSSNSIYEVVVQPYSTKLLSVMPEPRRNHGAEIINDKIYILGGTTSGFTKDALDSVIVYDVANNKCERMLPLPYAVCGMSTVSWQNKVIVLGGQDKNGQSLNDVIMYDIITEESERLPSMKYKRYGCSAIITADCVVVMGGWNIEQGTLDTVECLSLSSNSWQEMPPMIECRRWATAVVKPC